MSSATRSTLSPGLVTGARLQIARTRLDPKAARFLRSLSEEGLALELTAAENARMDLLLRHHDAMEALGKDLKDADSFELAGMPERALELRQRVQRQRKAADDSLAKRLGL